MTQSKITIVGVGDDGSQGLTQQAIEVIFSQLPIEIPDQHRRRKSVLVQSHSVATALVQA